MLESFLHKKNYKKPIRALLNSSSKFLKIAISNTKAVLISARDYFQRISGNVNCLTNSERTACVLYASSSSLAKMSSERFS